MHLFLVALSLLPLLHRAGGVPPHIVFIVLDDAGFNDVSLHGSPQVPTPNIDAIAASGVSLLRYYTQPVCSPTRASLMTGRHAIHHGIVRRQGLGLPPQLRADKPATKEGVARCLGRSPFAPHSRSTFPLITASA